MFVFTVGTLSEFICSASESQCGPKRHQLSALLRVKNIVAVENTLSNFCFFLTPLRALFPLTKRQILSFEGGNNTFGVQICLKTPSLQSDTSKIRGYFKCFMLA
eukprot:GEMP01153383.1.p1 GENE.GEMP01153383.1~~GEMP01153383.1.p1  ORF type:complete len:104 (-),score=0.19 GEMP01153383.1:17-328(-)